MAVHDVTNLGRAAATIGIVLAIRQLFQQGLTAIRGVMSNRIGPKLLVAALVCSLGSRIARPAQATVETTDGG